MGNLKGYTRNPLGRRCVLPLAILGICSLGLNLKASGKPSPNASSKAILPPPDYDTFAPPSKGEAYVDPVFGTRIVRLTGDHEICGWNGERAMFSPDDRYFAIPVRAEGAVVRLLDGRTGAFIRDIALDIPDSSVIRWGFEPAMLVYPSSNTLVALDVETDATRVLHTFDAPIGDERGRLCGGDGNDCDDKGEWLLINIGDELFAHNLRTGESGPRHRAPPRMDFATISASGDYIITLSYEKGTELWTRSWKYVRQLFPTSVHMEAGYLRGDEECIVGKIAKPGRALWEKWGVGGPDILAVRFSDGHVFRLLEGTEWYPYQMTGVGGSNRRAVYAMIGTHAKAPEEQWERYWGEIVEIRLDEFPRVRRLAHHRCRPTGGKENWADQPEPWINHAGDRLFFRSNMACRGLKGHHDLYMIEFESNGGE